MSPEPGRPLPPGGRLCTFRVDHLLVGVEVERVQEVVHPQPVTPVPLAPAPVEGLMNLRGRIVTVIDLRRALRLPSRQPGEPVMHAVLRVEDEAVSFLVDRAEEVVAPPATAFVPVPPTASARLRSLALGAFRLDGRLLVVLDPAELASAAAPRDTLRRPA